MIFILNLFLNLLLKAKNLHQIAKQHQNQANVFCSVCLLIAQVQKEEKFWFPQVVQKFLLMKQRFRHANRHPEMAVACILTPQEAVYFTKYAHVNAKQALISNFVI